MLKVQVERDNWLRGEGASYLRDHDGRMCCIGFACLAAGMKEEDIVGHMMVISDCLEMGDVPEVLKATLMEDNGSASEEADELYVTNDNRSISDSQRETMLKDYGKAAGIEFEFV